MTDFEGSQIFEAQFADEPQPPRRRLSPVGMIMLGMVIAILAVPLFFMFVPQETARWYLAAAEEQRLDGDLDGALKNLNNAIERFPDRAELLLKRAEWRMELDKHQQALADVNRVLELSPNNVEGYMLRSQIHQHLGRFDEAVGDMERLLEYSEQNRGVSRASALNGLAYARALANQELDQALEEIEEALRAAGPNAAFLDTRGFIHYLRGDLDPARVDMDDAVDAIELEHEQWARQLRGEQLGVLDKREGELAFEKHAESVAVIRYHRALLLDALGESEKAERDRQRVIELGYEPGDHLF